MLDQQGKLDQALEYYDRALAIFEQSVGPEHPTVARILGNIAVVLVQQGQLDTALQHDHRALTIFEHALGPEHPDYALMLVNIGAILQEQGEHREARDHIHRALVIYERALDPEHHSFVYPSIQLATIAVEQRDLATARRHAERAVSILEGDHAEPTSLAPARFLLARALWPDRAERARARTLAEQARQTWTEAGPDYDDERRKAEGWLATHRVR